MELSGLADLTLALPFLFFPGAAGRLLRRLQSE